MRSIQRSWELPAVRSIHYYSVPAVRYKDIRNDVANHCWTLDLRRSAYEHLRAFSFECLLWLVSNTDGSNESRFEAGGGAAGATGAAGAGGAAGTAALHLQCLLFILGSTCVSYVVYF